MIIEVLPNLFKMEIPLPGNPLKTLNSYVVMGKTRHLIIDTGFNRPECLEAMTSSLKHLNVSLAQCDFFLTHMHADHTGLVSTLAAESSRIYCSRTDGRFLDPSHFSEHWQRMSRLLFSHGFPPEELKLAIAKHPANQYSIKKALELTFINDGDVLEINGYSFTCIFTPGHTPGHVCLYEPTQQVLISGDHILDDITPNITLWPKMNDSLFTYLRNLEKTSRLAVKLVLPGHRRLIHNLQDRIEELKQHHRRRLQVILDILKNKTLTSYQTASQMPWDLSYSSFEQFPAAQKYFATGEAASHLEYLYQSGVIRKICDNGQYCYSLAD